MPRDPEPPEPVLSELQARLRGVESALLDAIAVMVREPALVSLVGRRLMRAVTMITKARNTSADSPRKPVHGVQAILGH